MNFPGGSICSSNRHEFSRRVYLFIEQTRIFQEGLSKRHVFSRRGSICSSNRPYYLIEQILIFLTNPYLVLEHILIFQEPLFSHRTDTHFSRKPYLVLEHLRFSRRPYLVLEHIQFSRSPLCLEHIGIFQEGTPSRTDISLIGLGGCFRTDELKYLGGTIGNEKFNRHRHT